MTRKAGWAARSSIEAILISGVRIKREGQSRPVTDPGEIGAPSTVDELTPSELKVLSLVAAGRTNAAIALQLSCSPRTVAKHLEHVYLKLHVANRAAAAALLATETAEQRRLAPELRG